MSSSDSAKLNLQDSNRRKFLQAMSAAGGVGLAGCNFLSGGGDGDTDGGDGDGGGSDELGERVPTLIFKYFSNAGPTPTQEACLPAIRQSIQDRLGVTLDIQPVELSTHIANVLRDQRTHHIRFWYYNPVPTRSDPDSILRRFIIQHAGNTETLNSSNYADCDYTELVEQQTVATSRSNRQEIVADALSLLSEDHVVLPIANRMAYAAARNGSVNVQDVGQAGMLKSNPEFYMNSTPRTGNRIIADTSPPLVETTNFPTIASIIPLSVWTQFVHSPLIYYDRNWELQNGLAENFDVENDGRRVTVELRDSTFHNGDSITAEDVAFTFRLLAEHAGIYQQADQVPYESINVVDNRTVEFNFAEPYLIFINKTMPLWGILHKRTWEEGGAMEDPQEFTFDPIIGSGPFEVDTLESGQLMRLVPHDDNPIFSPDHEIVFQVFRNEQTKIQAFKAEEVDIIAGLSPSGFENIRNSMSSDEVTTHSVKGFMPFVIFPEFPRAPGKFDAFREAMGASIDRRQINQSAFFGESDEPTHASVIMSNHPFYPEDDSSIAKYTDNPEGDEDRARQVLRDAGWGWDDDGNLHYPVDADLTPLWEEGETPSSDDYPCLDESGNYVGS